MTDNTSTGQAKKGGEIGLNGEFYKGGQFLPSSENTIKGEHKVLVTGKREIMPYTWEVQPAHDMLSIFDRIKNYVRTNASELEYIKGEGWQGEFQLVFEDSDHFSGRKYDANSYPVLKFRQITLDVRNGWCKDAECNHPNHQGWCYEYDAIREPMNPDQISHVEKLVAKFNNGERWFNLTDDPYHHLNN